MFGRPFRSSVRGIVGWGLPWEGITPSSSASSSFLPSGAAVAADFQENVALRDAHTRVWEATHHQVFVHPITGQPTSLEVDVPSQIVEKGTDINYRTPEGAWERTDTTIQPAGPNPAVAGAVLEAVRQRAKIHFSPTGENSWNVSYSVDGQAIRTGVRALALFVPETGQRHIIGIAQVCSPVADGNRAVYSSVFPGCDVVYDNGNVTLKQNLILREDFTMPDPASYGMNAASAMLVVITEIDLSQTDRAVVARTREGELNLRATALADASVLEFRDNDGHAVHRFEPGFAWSGSGVAQVSRPVTDNGLPVWKRFQWEDGKLLLLEGLRYTALAELRRPVVIDYVQTAVPLGKDEVWDRNKTYWITDPYYVHGCKLVIEPGTVVKFGDDDNNDDECIVVTNTGVVRAVGEPYLPIFLTAYSDDGYGEDTDTDDEEDEFPDEVTPTRGSFAAAFYFHAATGNDSKIQFCRFRWAADGIVNHRSGIDNAVRDCIFNECEAAVRELDWSEASVGQDPSMTLTNNLVYACDNGVILSATSPYGEMGQQVDMTMHLYHNTFDDVDGSAVLITSNDPEIALTMTAKNNVMSSCAYGFNDPDSKIATVDSTLDTDYNGFANLSSSSACYTGWFSDGGNSPSYESDPQFDTNNVSNGNHYLDQQGAFVDCGDGVLSDYGITGMTTKAPTEFDAVNEQNAYGTTTMSVATADTGTIDLGYHHPRVDYIVGCNPTKGSLESTTFGSNATLTVNSSVVVAMFRPNFTSTANAFFTNLLCLGTAHINTGIQQTSSKPFDREDMVHFDSSYYLGTKFVAMRFMDEENSYGAFTDAGAVWLHGHYSEVWASLFRHMHIGLVFDTCKQTADEHMKGNVFERCDAGIFAYNLLPTEEQVQDYDDFSNLHTMYDLFLNVKFVACYLDTDDTEYGYLCTFHNHTMLNCPYGVWMDANGYQTYWATVLQCDLNCFVGCREAGISGVPDYEDMQRVYFGSKWDFSGPEPHDCFWNNGVDLEPDTVTIMYSYVNHQNPFLVSLAGCSVFEKEWQSVYLSQKTGDASRLPFQIGQVAGDSSVINDVAGWPDGTFTVNVYGLSNLSQWSIVYDSRAWVTITDNSAGTPGYDTDVNDPQDLLIQITRTAGDPGAESGHCSFDLKLANGSELTIYLDKNTIGDIAWSESVCVWVGMDGSTFAANADWTSSDVLDEMVMRGARFAMWYASGALMVSRYDAAGTSPAVDMYQTSGGSNGYTATDQTIDDNDLLDAGYHYQGWNYRP
ncbi:hypothetical protein HS125_13695 [bacterium]|nr:hypothetical protein [bacterium]